MTKIMPKEQMELIISNLFSKELLGELESNHLIGEYLSQVEGELIADGYSESFVFGDFRKFVNEEYELNLG